MKTKTIYAGLVMSLLVLLAPVSNAFAAGIVLQHGGAGQKAGDNTTLGLAICNKGTQAVVGDVPFSVVANGKTVNATVNGSLAAGACQYTYLAYSSFNMTAGNTYSAVVTLDPNRTLGATVDVPATYSITVPSAGKVLGASTTNGDQRSQLLAQLASMVAILEGLLARLMGR